jgi:putative SOS response-associated peptidase YedK
MCGRIARTSPAEVLAVEFGVAPPPDLDLRPRWNVCPGDDLLIVVRTPDERRIGTVRWGFLPWFARDPAAGPRSINARAETVATRPAFRDAFRRRRCLVVADAFYEWRREGRARQPFAVRLSARRPMALAGLWERWRPPEGPPVLTGLVITCPAAGRVAAIHDRMPVILDAGAAARWLDPTLDDPRALGRLLAPYPDEALECWAVSARVNSPRNDGPDLLEPLDAVTPPSSTPPPRSTAPRSVASP